ncbi:sulfotransferase domain-containing protein [Rhodanobacter koreensis]
MGNIVWLASYPKSGNTWLRAFLANLLANSPAPLPFDEWLRYGDDEALPYRFSEVAGCDSTSMDIDRLSEVRPQVHALIAARARGTAFVKTHNLNGSFSGYPLHNPDVTAGAIYVVRNPLDVAISMSAHFSLSLDEAIERLGNDDVATANDALFVSQLLGNWSRHVSSWADAAGPKVLIVRYEDMLEKPAKVFLKVARLIGLDRDRERLDRAIRFAGFNQLQGMERQSGFREAPRADAPFFRAGRANQWRERLSRDQVRRVIFDHGSVMQRFRYVPAGY